MDTAKLQGFLQAQWPVIADFHARALAFQREKNRQRPRAQRHSPKRLQREVVAMVAAFVATRYRQGHPAARNLAYHAWLTVIEQACDFKS